MHRRDVRNRRRGASRPWDGRGHHHLYPLHPTNGQRFGHRPTARRLRHFDLRRVHLRRAAQYAWHAAISLYRIRRLRHGQGGQGGKGPRLDHHVLRPRRPVLLRCAGHRRPPACGSVREVRRPAGNLRPHLPRPRLHHQPVRRQPNQRPAHGRRRAVPRHHRRGPPERRNALHLRLAPARQRHRPHAHRGRRVPVGGTVLPGL